MVFVVQAGRDTYDATRYGRIYTILGPNDEIVGEARFAQEKLDKALRDFKDTDFLLLAGDPVAIGIATYFAARSNNGRVRFLKWDRRRTAYYPIDVTLWGEKRDGGPTHGSGTQARKRTGPAGS